MLCSFHPQEHTAQIAWGRKVKDGLIELTYDSLFVASSRGLGITVECICMSTQVICKHGVMAEVDRCRASNPLFFNGKYLLSPQQVGGMK